MCPRSAQVSRAGDLDGAKSARAHTVAHEYLRGMRIGPFAVGAAAIAFVAAVACSTSEQDPSLELTSAVGVDDVSFLYPLPSQQKRTSLLGAASAGTRGELLPRDLFRAIPPLDILTPNAENYSLLRVVSVRLDPCFPGLGVKDETACKNQIRLVMQPVLPKPGTLGLAAADLALHLFYSVTRAELAGVLQELVNLREASGIERSDGPVGIHPALGREGIDGRFGAGLRTLLLAHAGRDNLTRVTFMGVEQVGQAWRFGGFEVEGGVMRPMQIPLVSVNEQTFKNHDLDGVTFDQAGTVPVSPAVDDIRLLFDPAGLATATQDERRSAYRKALRIENPKSNSPDTIDCATCHAASAARRFVERTYGLSPDGAAELYAHPRGLPLSGAKGTATNELRAFGYFDDHPSISPRTVNETAEVVEHVLSFVRRGVR